jgi:hypothetical protein
MLSVDCSALCYCGLCVAEAGLEPSRLQDIYESFTSAQISFIGAGMTERTSVEVELYSLQHVDDFTFEELCKVL